MPLAICSKPELLSLLRGGGNFGKIWSACGQHKIQHTTRRVNKYTHNYMRIFTVYLSVYDAL